MGWLRLLRYPASGANAEEDIPEKHSRSTEAVCLSAYVCAPKGVSYSSGELTLETMHNRPMCRRPASVLTPHTHSNVSFC